MESRVWLDRVATIGAILVLVLVIVTVAMASHNRSLQEQVAAGQQRLASAQTAANVDNTLIRLLTTAAVEHNDPAIKALLAANGVTYQTNPAGAVATPAPVAGGAQ